MDTRTVLLLLIGAGAMVKILDGGADPLGMMMPTDDASRRRLKDGAKMAGLAAAAYLLMGKD